ncbi:MAG: hypothetical protein Q8P89_02395 [bacterium]|nr:hypothetical protein [bacterium]
MRPNRLSKDVLTVAALTCVTVFTWIALDIYHTFNRPEIPNVPSEQLAPLDPNINAGVLDKLNLRQVYDKLEFVKPISTESAKIKI